MSSTRINLSVRATIDGAAPTSGGLLSAVELSRILGAGTGADQADTVLHRRITLAGGAQAVVDLQADLDPYGVAAGLAEWRIFAIQAAASNGSTVSIAPDGSTPYTGLVGASGSLPVPAGGVVIMTATGDGQKPITPSAKKLELTNNDGSAAAVVDVLVVGVSA
tara:strand:+ start:5875 stop:6366 length:492 start_codon:yes stop_codon:yes gene_type:complete